MSNLADALKKASGGDSAPVQNRSTTSLNTLASYRAFKALGYGAWKSGKTSFVLSLIDYLSHTKMPENKPGEPTIPPGLGLKAEDCLIVLQDCDDGFLPLVAKEDVAPQWHRIPDEWKSRIEYRMHSPVGGFDDVEATTDEWLPKLQAWQKEHGPETAWLVVDGTKTVWQWARDSHCQDVYGMHEHELAAARRKEALARGKQTLPTLNQQFDYGAITPKYSRWADTIKLSGVNFIWLTPEDVRDVEDEDGGPKKSVRKPGGQKGDPGRVDQILYFRTNGGKFYMDLEGTRTGKACWANMPDPTIRKLVAALNKR